MSLTAPERETVITFSDEDNTAQVHTHQRRVITALDKNPLATKTEDISFDGTAGAVYEIPADRVRFLSQYRNREATAEQVKNLAKAREVQQLNSVVAESSADGSAGRCPST